MSAPMTPDRVRTDALQVGDRLWHPYDMVRFTVGAAPAPLDQPLTFHNRATDEMEPGMRVTGTDDRGDIVRVDVAPSYLWHRDVEQPTAPEAEPLVVRRFDIAMEPAPEEEQVLTIGCIAADGRPVALLLNLDDRPKVAGCEAWRVGPGREAVADRRRGHQRLRHHGTGCDRGEALEYWADGGDYPDLDGEQAIDGGFEIRRVDRWQRGSLAGALIGPEIQCPGCRKLAMRREWFHDPFRKCHGPIQWRENTNASSLRRRYRREHRATPVAVSG
ncbi:hypothetical protein [Streptomyces sp. MMS24-I29]|uniref:hypothetical protein n=1 Tax=Streptomyces sp. MMS24-I29 TaxID=3351480 RepID=UPI003C7CB4D0